MERELVKHAGTSGVGILLIILGLENPDPVLRYVLIGIGFLIYILHEFIRPPG